MSFLADRTQHHRLLASYRQSVCLSVALGTVANDTSCSNSASVWTSK